MNLSKSLLTALPVFAMSTAAVAEEIEKYAQETEVIVVTGSRAENANTIEEKAASQGIADFLSADDVGRLPDLNIAESLRRIPGVTSIFDEDRGRFVVVRGLNSNMNYVTIDGLGVATTDSFGGTGRKVNLEVIPASAVSKLEVRKTFTPEIDGGSIGGYVNLHTRSAFDLDEFYFVTEGGVNYYTYNDVPDNNNYAGSLDNKLGSQLDITAADTFGSDNQFGYVVSANWQQTSRDESKNIQAGQRYYDDEGNRVDPLLNDGSVNPAWNGMVAPEQVRSYDYTNKIETWGANAKFEYQASEDLYLSLMGYYYEEGQQETRNTFQILGLDGIQNQTPTSGEMLIANNGVRVGWNRNNLDRVNHGTIFSLNYDLGPLSELSLKSGLSYNSFEDFSPIIEYRGTPADARIFYQQSSDDPQQFHFSLPDGSAVMDPARFANTNYFENLRFSEETLFNTKLDFAHNQGRAASGFGYKVGVEYREIDRSRDNGRNAYVADGSTLGDLALTPDYRLDALDAPLLWVDHQGFFNQVRPGLSLNAQETANRAVQDDFQYLEDTMAGYAQLSYAGRDYTVIGGLRYEDVSTEAIVPGEDLSAPFVTNQGGYSKLLPSVLFSYEISTGLVLKSGISQSLGRPSPGDIAMRERRNDIDLTISRGNPDLQPRESTNYDLGLEYYFADGEGLLSAAIFYKDIENEIFTLGSTEVIDGQTYDVKQTQNAEGAKLKGIELGYIKNRFEFLPDALRGLGLSANLTLVDGETSYIDAAGEFKTFDRLLEQSEVSGNASVFYDWDGQAELRFSLNYQGDYHDSIQPKAWDERGWDDFMTVDMAFRYNINEHFDVKLQAKNMLDENRVRVRGIGLGNLFEEVEFGRSYWLNISYKY